MPHSRDWFGDGYVARDQPLSILNAEPPTPNWGGPNQLTETYTFTLSLNREPHSGEKKAINNNPFGLELTTSETRIIVHGSNLDEIAKVAQDLNDYVRQSSVSVLADMKDAADAKKKKAAEELVQAERLKKKAEDIKFHRE